MAQDPVLRTLFEELMAEYNANIDTSQGSTFSRSVMTPLLDRIGASPLDVDLETLFVDRARAEFPDLDVSEFAGIRDLVVKVMVVLASPIVREIRAERLKSSLNNFAQLTRAEVNDLLANFFIALESGQRASGLVRMYFLAPQSVTVTTLTRLSTGSGLNFFPTAIQSISSALMTFNLDGMLFYFDVSVQAEEVDEIYNVPAASINVVHGVSGAVRVSNLLDFDNAVSEETKEEGVTRAQESITVRNLTVERGISFTLQQNFATLVGQPIQVIGNGDDEMVRDILRGPIAVSSIPEGVFGDSVPEVTTGQFIHIGGKTDVYVFQRSPVTDTLDFKNLTDRGVRVLANNSGFTQAGSATSVFQDTRGNFGFNGVQVGDILRVGAEERVIANVQPSVLTLDAPLDGGLFGRDYEVVRRTDGLIQVGLYDLVAEDPTGAAVADSDGDPAQPLPGDEDLSALVVSGAYAKKTENIAESNLELPLLRVSSVELLDPLTLQATGALIPLKDLLLATNPAAMVGGGEFTQATGTIRCYFRDACSAWFPSSGAAARFTSNTITFTPDTPAVGTCRADTTGSTLILETLDYSALISAGDRIQVGQAVYTAMATPVFGGGESTVTVRESIDATFTSKGFTAFFGVLESTMQQDSATRLYFVDVPVTSPLSTPSANLAADTTFAVENVQTEGWSIRNLNDVNSFSTRERVYLELTDYVNDTTDLADTGTAYAIRLNYDYASTLSAMQDFAESPDNRPPAEDLLVRHFRPSYVRGQFEVKGASAALAKARVETFLLDLDPTVDLEVSDLSDALYGAGALKVTFPLTVVALAHRTDRTWEGTISVDTLGSSRVQHFLPDSDELLFTILAS